MTRVSSLGVGGGFNHLCEVEVPEGFAESVGNERDDGRRQGLREKGGRWVLLKIPRGDIDGVVEVTVTSRLHRQKVIREKGGFY